MKHRTGPKTLRWLLCLALMLGLILSMNMTALAADPTNIDVDGTPTSVYTVSDGFYQDGATYAASTNFYITNKAGLEYFRDLVSACDGGTIADAYAKAWVNTSSTAASFYTGNVFSI